MDAVRSLPQRSDPCCSVCGILSRLKVLRVERILLLDSEKVCVDIVARLHGTPLKVYNFRVSDSFAFYRTHSCPFDAYGVEVGAWNLFKTILSDREVRQEKCKSDAVVLWCLNVRSYYRYLESNDIMPKYFLSCAPSMTWPRKWSSRLDIAQACLRLLWREIQYLGTATYIPAPFALSANLRRVQVLM